jgi:hypothetical protein
MYKNIGQQNMTQQVKLKIMDACADNLSARACRFPHNRSSIHRLYDEQIQKIVIFQDDDLLSVINLIRYELLEGYLDAYLITSRFYFVIRPSSYYFAPGEMAERSIAAVLKTVDCKRSGGSNPSLSAKCLKCLYERRGIFFVSCDSSLLE